MSISGKDDTNMPTERPTWFSWEVISFQDSRRLETISLLFGGNERLLRFLFNLSRPELRKPRPVLRLEAKQLSTGEGVLIEIAMDIWSGGGRFSTIFVDLDSENLANFIRAICHVKEIRNQVMHALIDDENGGFCL